MFTTNRTLRWIVAAAAAFVLLGTSACAKRERKEFRTEETVEEGEVQDTSPGEMVPE
jgi:hypothetical protein